MDFTLRMCITSSVSNLLLYPAATMPFMERLYLRIWHFSTGAPGAVHYSESIAPPANLHPLAPFLSKRDTFSKSVTVVDTISTTVIFYFPPPEEWFLRKAGLFPNISGHRRDVRPNLLRSLMKWPRKVRQIFIEKIVQAAERACRLWIAGGKPFSFALMRRLL